MIHDFIICGLLNKNINEIKLISHASSVMWFNDITMFQGNWVDLVVFFILGYYVWRGFQQGVFLIISEMFAWVGGWWLGEQLTDRLAPELVTHFGLPLGWSRILLFFLLIGLITEGIYRGLSKITLHVSRQFFPWWWQGVLGAIPSMITGFVIVFVGTLIILSLDIRMLTKDMRESWYFNHVYIPVTRLVTV